MNKKKNTKKQIRAFRRYEYERSAKFKKSIKYHKDWLRKYGYVVSHPNKEYKPVKPKMNAPYYRSRLYYVKSEKTIKNQREYQHEYYMKVTKPKRQGK